MIRRTTMLVTVALATAAGAQSRQVPGEPITHPQVFINADIHPVTTDTLRGGWMVVENGRITMLGSGDHPVIDEADVVDLDGLHVYPGLVAADSILGLTETGAVDVTHDYDEYGSITPESRAVVALNPDSDLIPVTRNAGILTALVVPSGGRLPGQAAVIRLDGWDWEDLAVEPSAAMVIEWPSTDGRSGPSGSASRNVRELDAFLDDAQAYLKARSVDPTLPPDSRYAALAPMLEGDQPVLIKASTVGQISTAVAWARERGLDPIITGGEEADLAAELLIEEDVPVIVRGVHRRQSARHAAPDEPHTLPARLRDAGVRFCIAPRDRPAHLRNLPHHAATAVANGLTPEEGLRSVTIDAAEIIGVADRLGSLEPGKSATFIVTTGDPLQMRTTVEHAWIDGRPVDLSSRHTQLAQKYRQKYGRAAP